MSIVQWATWIAGVCYLAAAVDAWLHIQGWIGLMFLCYFGANVALGIHTLQIMAHK